MIKLYGSPKSRAFRCLWTLEELELEYENIAVDMRAGEHLSPEFKKLNPLSRVPVLQDDKITLFESAAICSYLAEQLPHRKLIPAVGTVERAHFYQWVSFITTELEQGLWTMGKHKFALPEEQRVPQMLEVGAWEFARAAKAMEAMVGDRQYLVGDHFTVADILAVHTLMWAKGSKVPLSPTLLRYLEGHQDRPALVKTRGLS